jgi:hypothetical protein
VEYCIPACWGEEELLEI